MISSRKDDSKMMYTATDMTV